MTPTDAGPLVALFNRNDPDHAACLALLPRLSSPLVTTWPCFTEAMYLLWRDIGYRAQAELWRYVSDGLLVLHVSSDAETEQMRLLMDKYADTPMDLADASLMAMLNALSLRRVFTLDSDFRVYRLADGQALEVLP